MQKCTRVLKSPLLSYVCVCSGKLPATIFIGTGPNLDTTCISKMSRFTLFEISNFHLKKSFLRPKMGTRFYRCACNATLNPVISCGLLVVTEIPYMQF